MTEQCDCFLVHYCSETERAARPLTWRGAVVFIAVPVLLAGAFVWLISSVS